MIRKDALCFPASLLHDSRMSLIAAQCGVSGPVLLHAYVLMLAHCANNPDADLRLLSAPEVWALTGLAQPEAFMKFFFLESGRLRFYDEYMAPGIKERHGAARRQKAWRERRKSPAPRRAPRKEIAVDDALFEEAWAKYPARAGGNPKAAAKKAWAARLREGASAQEMLEATDKYRKYCDDTARTGTEFVLHGKTFFGGRWREDWVAYAPLKPRPSGDDVLDTIMSEVSGAYATEA